MITHRKKPRIVRDERNTADDLKLTGYGSWTQSWNKSSKEDNESLIVDYLSPPRQVVFSMSISYINIYNFKDFISPHYYKPNPHIYFQA